MDMRFALAVLLAGALFSGCTQPPASRANASDGSAANHANATGTPCGGWTTFGDTACECSGRLERIPCPEGALCDSGSDVCYGTCGKCKCYQGPAKDGREVPCGGTGQANASHPVISKVYANGFCPGGCVRNLTVFPDGKAAYYERVGEMNVVQGKSGVLSAQQLASLARLIQESGFFSLNESYNCENAPTDAGGNTFYFKNASAEKSVWVYGGCQLPAQLEPLNAELERIKSGLQ